jgi:hypothetical protein
VQETNPEEAKRRAAVKEEEAKLTNAVCEPQVEIAKLGEVQSISLWRLIQKQIIPSSNSHRSFADLPESQLEFVLQQAHQIRTLDPESIQTLMAQGTIPVGIWNNLQTNSATSVQSVSQSLSQQMQQISNGIEEISLQIQALEAKKQALQQEIVQISARKTKWSNLLTHTAADVRKLASVDDLVVGTLRNAVDSPNFLVYDMQPVDIALVLSMHGLVSLHESIVKANISAEELAIMIETKEYPPELGNYLEFREMEFAWDLLQTGQFSPGEHLVACSVCRGQRDDVIREWRLSLDCSQYPNICTSQLLYVPVQDLFKVFKLPARELAKYKEMKAVHENCLKND